jgi:hypothetical protein
MRLPSTGIGFALLLGALAALPPLAIDMALPALSPIVAAMGTTASLAGLTLGVFLAGFAIGPIAYRPCGGPAGPTAGAAGWAHPVYDRRPGISQPTPTSVVRRPDPRICVLKQRPRVCPVLLSAPDTL